MELLCRKVHKDARLPQRAHDWDAGLDLYSTEDRVLFYQHTVGIRTGIQVAIPEGHFGLLTIRSSLGKRGIQLANAPGVIDAGYRGEVIVLLTTLNKSLNYARIATGQKIAQLVIVPIPSISPVFVEELPLSDGRNLGGFGSSGSY